MKKLNIFLDYFVYSFLYIFTNFVFLLGTFTLLSLFYYFDSIFLSVCFFTFVVFASVYGLKHSNPFERDSKGSNDLVSQLHLPVPHDVLSKWNDLIFNKDK